jgi:peptidoglycan/xylan/chitin deacetylase (PgdA/CDA1 family)
MSRARSGSNRNRLLVLGYHNIESTWCWPASPGGGLRSFARQMTVLKRTVNFVSLDKALQSLDTGRPLPPRAVALTFDDGYRDNLTLAVPLLSRLKIPATVFLVPGFLSGQVHAWWERLAWATSCARVGSVDFESRHFDLSKTPERILALRSIEESLKGRDHAARQSAVEALVEALDPDRDYHADELFMDWEGARHLVRAGISIGSHTMRHAILARENEQSQREDLCESRRLLQDHLEIPIKALAYPNGGRNDYNSVTVAAAREAGYSHAVTAWGRISSPETPAYEISRRLASPEHSALRLSASIVRDLVATQSDSNRPAAR